MKPHGYLITAGILLTLSLSSTAYAYYTKSLKLTGSVVLTPPLNLELTEAAIQIMRPGESMTLDPNKKSLRFYVSLVDPGDQRIVNFKVKNTGSNPVLLQNMLPQNPDPATGVSVQWPAMNNIVMAPNSVSEEFTILILWEPSAIGVPEGTVIFAATLQYAQYIP
ncbi:MAG: hypothetical protein FWG40_01365 [Peptococcaceae bacterium]|nr:hypothetical protein [Peptococcaceae bacterium]